jgi:hypothetical protein
MRTTQAIPEAAGPGTETDSGAIIPGQPGQLRSGPLPLPTPDERAARLAEFDAVAASCLCAPIPDAVLIPLRQLVARAGLPALSGCPRCRSIPWDVLTPLAELARQQAGALS